MSGSQVFHVARLKKVGHWLSCSSCSGTERKSEGIAHSPQQVLVMVKRLRFEVALYLGADYERGDPPSATARNGCAATIIGVEGALIPNDEE